MNKEFKLPINKDKRYIFLIKFLATFVEEYGTLSEREIDVLAELYKLNDKYKAVPEEDKGKLIFHADNKRAIANKLEITMFNIGNILSSLTKKGFRDELGLPKVIPMMDSITIKFIDND
jgi:hypothetical protein